MQDLTFDDFYYNNIVCRGCGEWVDGSRFEQVETGVSRFFKVCCPATTGNWIMWDSKEVSSNYSWEPEPLENQLRFINRFYAKAC